MFRLIHKSKHRTLAKTIFCCICLLACKLHANTQDMLLIGGGLKICSSYSTKNCSKPISYDKSAYSKTLYTIDDNSIKRIATNQYNVFASNQQKKDIINLLEKYQLRFKSEPVERRTLLRRLDKLKTTEHQKLGREVLDALSPNAFNFVTHNLIVPVLGPSGKPLTEYVNLGLSDPHSVEIIEYFVSLLKQRKIAAKRKPMVLVSTASANNPFDAVSFYIQLFSQFNVEVVWLPLDANLNDILHNDNLTCDDLERNRSLQFSQFNRDTIYPTLTNYQSMFCKKPNYIGELIEKADGLFFNGGDQFLTLSSLAETGQTEPIYNRYYDLIKKRFNQGQLVVAGTSAGSAVQGGGLVDGKSIPMITNGPSIPGLFNGAQATRTPPNRSCSKAKNCESNTDIDSLTYLASGGFDLVPSGIIDTHFSERDRLFRLLRLLSDSQTQFGIGIDENTAVHIQQTASESSSSPKRYKTIGESGVWHVNLQQPLKSKSKEKLIKAKVAVDSKHKAADQVWQWLGENKIADLIKSASKNKQGQAQMTIEHGQDKALVSLILSGSEFEIRVEFLD